MREMLLEVEYCQKTAAAKFNKPLRMTDDEEPDFKQAKECHICGSKYGEKDIKVRDQCHITGKYRGSAHQDCSLKLLINPKEMKIPVIFHNLSGYDNHFIMQEIGSIDKQHNVDINAFQITWKNTWHSCLVNILFLWIVYNLWPVVRENLQLLYVKIEV